MSEWKAMSSITLSGKTATMRMRRVPVGEQVTIQFEATCGATVVTRSLSIKPDPARSADDITSSIADCSVLAAKEAIGHEVNKTLIDSAFA